MPHMYKTALVTGGAGFIGSHIADALIRRHIKVYVVDDLSRGLIKNVNPNAHFTKLSILSPQFFKLMEKIAPDIVFHCAAQINVREAVKDPVADAQTNILGTLKLAHLASTLGVKKFIFSSTGGAMYADTLRPPYSEKVPADPLSPYGIAKRASEMYLAFEQAVYGMPFVALRYANVYGPRQRCDGEAGVVAVFGKGLLESKPVVIYGDGKQTRDYVYVEDVVRANMLAMTRPVTGIYHIGTGKETSVNVLFRKMKKMSSSSLPERHGPACPGEVIRSALDSRKAKKELGWTPRVSLDDGLKKTLAWLSTHA